MSRFSRLLSALGLATALTLVAATATASESIDLSAASLRQAAGELNSQLPMQLDADHRLMKVDVAGGKRLIYVIELARVSSRDVQGVDQDEMVSWIRNSMGAQACARAGMQMMHEGGITVSYRFVDTRGKKVMNFDMKPSDC